MTRIIRHPAITESFDMLAARLREIVGQRPILFFVNPGNWGDSLIREGAEAFLGHYGFRYRATRFGDLLRRRTNLAQEIERAGRSPVMVYCGNGAFSGHYDLAAKIAKLTHEFDTSVILPSTLAMDPDALDFAPNTTFFVRDRSESAKRMPGAMFCHDMAFFLEPEAVSAGFGEGWFLRSDHERPAGTPLHRKNVDISRLGRAFSPVEPFLARIARFRTVHTNRLHVGVAAAILGKDVRLYSNDYFKIQAIYEASLAPYFPNVHFAEAFSFPGRDVRRWYHRFV